AVAVVVHESAEFDAWQAGESQPVDAPDGHELFILAGGAACHAVRGTSAGGAVGPDLTHFASRRSMAAGTVPISAENLSSWLLDPEHHKPDVRMPSYESLAETERNALVSYLLDLK